ncbi:MAG TPA: ABC transporter permease [Candidatus Angelobacter sp.]|nr:ABC transporter permease [Candidatus Angelobacter sp.]
MHFFRTQLKQVVRRLARTPLFTIVTLVTLAAAVGANTVVFSVLEGILLKPLPYPDSERLVSVAEAVPKVGFKELPGGPCTYFIFREQNTSFQDVGMMRSDPVSVTGIAEPEQVRGMRVTDAILPLLGATPALGRAFTHQDDSPGAADTAMLMYGYWQRKFGGKRDVEGKTITVDGKPRVIIGVLAQNFHFMDQEDPALLVPFQFDRSKTMLGEFSYPTIARLKPNVTIEQASADEARMLPIVGNSFPMPPGFSPKMYEEAHFEPNIKPLKNKVIGDVGNTLWVLMGSIGMVLLIACANVANLVLVRVEARRQELAICAALGARWSRIASELLFESVFLGLLGSLFGLGLAYAILRVLVAMAPKGLPRINEIGIDGPVLLFTFVVALLASVLLGCIPVFKYGGARLVTALREGARGLSQSRSQNRARSVLVVVQVALALVLLICSGLMARTFMALTRIQPGFEKPAEIQTFALNIPKTEIADDERVVRAYEEILHKVGAIPGVSSVGLASTIPMDGKNSIDPIFAQDRTYKPGEINALRRFKYISPGFLATMGTPLVAGRDLTWTDLYNKTPVALISDSLARELWQSPANALGKRFRSKTEDDWREVAGVVANVYDDGVNKEPSKSVYWPIMMGKYDSEPLYVERGLSVVLRSPAAGTETLMKNVRQSVWSVDPNLTFGNVRTVDYFYRGSMARTSFTLMMLGVASAIALLLGVVGIYGVIAYSVSQRRREIGIRMALGAQPNELTGLFVRQGMVLTGIGVVCGLIAAFATMRLLTSLLFGVSPLDVATYVAVSLALVVLSWLASYVPSRRSAVVDPVEALRGE